MKGELNNRVIPIAPIDRLIRKTNAERVSESAAKELGIILEELGKEIALRAADLCKQMLAYAGKGRFTPEACVALAQAYPGLTLVLSHLGGGAFLYELMPEVRECLRDVYYDTAAIPFLYDPRVYEVAATAAGSEKLLFGSDYPLVTPMRCLEGLERLSAPQQKAVRSDNARRVFSL